jgi:hypothetical protein
MRYKLSMQVSTAEIWDSQVIITSNNTIFLIVKAYSRIEAY